MICITILLQVDRHDEALQDITTSLDLNPTSFKALRTRARIHMHFEKFDAAIADFNSALELADNSAEQKSIQAECVYRCFPQRVWLRMIGPDGTLATFFPFTLFVLRRLQSISSMVCPCREPVHSRYNLFIPLLFTNSILLITFSAYILFFQSTKN